jgi:hypothetical protein
MEVSSKGSQKKITKKIRFTYLHKIGAAVCLLSLAVMVASGILAGVPILTVAFRACIAMIVVKVIFRILVSIFATYEEMNSGKA